MVTWIATRPRTAKHTFGYRRSEIMGALLNAATLGVAGVLVITEAIERLDTASVPGCAAADCRRSNVLIVHPDGAIAESHIFMANSERTFSLFGGQLGSVGTWTGTPDALTVTLNRTETRKEGSCSASSLVLNGVSWTRADPELQEAAWAAWAANDWAGVAIPERE